MLLQSFDRFDQLANFDPKTGEWTELPPSRDATGSAQKTSGQYGRAGEHLVILYRLGDSIYLRIGDSTLELDGRVTVHVQRSSLRRKTISISQGGDVLFQSDYEPPTQAVPIEDDPTPFVEEEDFDFALFIANISKEPERRSRLFRNR